MYCIETDALYFRYGHQDPVLKGPELKVPEGAIYGFLGPNGAGKTTTLRLLLGLLQEQQEHSIRLFGLPLATNRIPVLRRTGSLIESPSLYAHLNAVDNLSVWQYACGCPRRRIKEVLRLVGLDATANKKAAAFSLGMKQRLGLAIALLHEPRLLILDEPTNGLDPNGIIDMRVLLQQLNRELGMTIVVSSHLLPEIEKLVTHAGIIHDGQLLFQGTLDALTTRQAAAAAVSWDTDNPELLLRLAQQRHMDALAVNGSVLIRNMDRQHIVQLNKELVQHGVGVYRINAPQQDLESVFMNVINS